MRIRDESNSNGNWECVRFSPHALSPGVGDICLPHMTKSRLFLHQLFNSLLERVRHLLQAWADLSQHLTLPRKGQRLNPLIIDWQSQHCPSENFASPFIKPFQNYFSFHDIKSDRMQSCYTYRSPQSKKNSSIDGVAPSLPTDTKVIHSFPTLSTGYLRGKRLTQLMLWCLLTRVEPSKIFCEMSKLLLLALHCMKY